MHTALLALRAHRDLAKLDFEDGVARAFPAERLARPSSISSIRVDMRAENQFDNSETNQSIDALIWLRAHDRGDLGPAPLRRELEHMASDLAGWFVDSREVRPTEVDWHGTASPGVKIALFLRRAGDTGIDEFRALLDAAADDAAARVSHGGVERHLITGDLFRSPELDGVVTFWFPNLARLDQSIRMGAFQAIEDVPFLDKLQGRRLLTFEQRLTPNPNVWAGLQPAAASA